MGRGGRKVDEHETLDINADLGPNRRDTAARMRGNREVEAHGFYDESDAVEMSHEDDTILHEIEEAVMGSDHKMDSKIDWPRISESPMNEYGSQRIFCMAFPWLFPGGYGDIKDFKGEIGEWGEMLLRYKDNRFASDKLFCFFALNYITRHRNAKQSQWFLTKFNNGGPQTLEELQEAIHNGDNRFINRITYVNNKVKGSTPFWHQKRGELYSWINHHVAAGNGPPMYFITLSCAEHYWPDIIRLIKERMEIASPTLSRHLNEYSLVVQEFFQARVELWLKSVGRHIFGIRHYWVRYEFAPGRGQIHAHLLAVSEDSSIYELCHRDLQKPDGEERRTQRLAEWAKKKFGLTASVSPGYNHDSSKAHPSTIRFSLSDANTDADELLKSCQEHQCSGYCMRRATNQHEHRRECRSGAGFEATKGACDTPGFELRKNAAVVIERRTKKLQMPRNNRRIVQSSVDLLRSWRGNCDVQILIYDSAPSEVDVKEISRLTDYIVGYTCKGGTTLREERETNKQMALNMPTVKNDETDLKHLVKKLMNKAATRRLITKQECCVLLSNLDLTLCSEQISTVSLSPAERIKSSGKNTTTGNFLTKYKTRPIQYEHLSLDEYFHADRRERNLPRGIPHYLGLAGVPTYPVTKAYARHALTVYKPWREQQNDQNWIEEFDLFIHHRNCPTAARMEYERVMQRFYNGTKFVDPVASETCTTGEMEKDDEAAILLAGLAGGKIKDYDETVFSGIKKGRSILGIKLHR